MNDMAERTGPLCRFRAARPSNIDISVSGLSNLNAFLQTSNEDSSQSKSASGVRSPTGTEKDASASRRAARPGEPRYGGILHQTGPLGSSPGVAWMSGLAGRA